MKNKNLPALKANIAKKMVASQKFIKTPPLTPRQKRVDLVYGHHGKQGKNLTYQKKKGFTKESSNASYSKKVGSIAGGYENS